MKFLAYILLPLMFLSCNSKDSNYLHHSVRPALMSNTEEFLIKDLLGSNKVDIIWVVDNSGSMGDIQNNIIINAGLFMEELTKISFLYWKMGIISTDTSEAPFLGFKRSDLFDYTTPDPVNLFVDRFKDLGVYGSASEFVFRSVSQNIFNYRDFLRPNTAGVAVIMVSDEVEQSRTDPSVDGLIEDFNTMGIPPEKLRFYGALYGKDLPGCNPNDDGDLVYSGSRYESIITKTGGFVISACTSDFGVGLARIGEDVARLVNFPSLLLGNRPVLESIKVTYNGTVLPGGLPEDGGFWYYSKIDNRIVFYDVEFATGLSEKVLVEFDIDDGHGRGK